MHAQKEKFNTVASQMRTHVQNIVTIYFDSLCTVIIHWQMITNEGKEAYLKHSKVRKEQTSMTIFGHEREKVRNRPWRGNNPWTPPPYLSHSVKNRLPLLRRHIGSEVFIHSPTGATIESTHVECLHDAKVIFRIFFSSSFR